MSLTQSQRQLKDLFRHSDEPILTATEIAEEFGITQQAAHRRLQRLYEDGVIEKKEVGASAVAWWWPQDQSLSPSA